MRILVIAPNIGRTAPGIVFERLIDGVSKKHEVDLIVADYDPSSTLSSVKSIKAIKKTAVHQRIFKLAVSILGFDPFDRIWSNKAVKAAKQMKANYDIVFSLISFHHYTPLQAGLNISRQKSAKWVIYSVDAIPAPLGWSEDNSYFRSVKRLMQKYLSICDSFFSANQQMLDYQLSFIQPKKEFKSGVLFNPGFGKLVEFKRDPSSPPVFLYTGGIYQVRKADYILKAFEKFLTVEPQAKFIFVGTVLNQNLVASLSEKTRQAIEIYPFAKDLTPFYERATALIDLDADLENDVFLSSKIVNYLGINRVIISETGINSPSRHLFRDIPSIIQCGHNDGELYNAMIFAEATRKALVFDDRKEVITQFSIESVIEKFEDSIS